MPKEQAVLYQGIDYDLVFVQVKQRIYPCTELFLLQEKKETRTRCSDRGFP